MGIGIRYPVCRSSGTRKRIPLLVLSGSALVLICSSGSASAQTAAQCALMRQQIQQGISTAQQQAEAGWASASQITMQNVQLMQNSPGWRRCLSGGGNGGPQMVMPKSVLGGGKGAAIAGAAGALIQLFGGMGGAGGSGADSSASGSTYSPPPPTPDETEETASLPGPAPAIPPAEATPPALPADNPFFTLPSDNPFPSNAQGPAEVNDTSAAADPWNSSSDAPASDLTKSTDPDWAAGADNEDASPSVSTGGQANSTTDDASASNTNANPSVQSSDASGPPNGNNGDANSTGVNATGNTADSTNTSNMTANSPTQSSDASGVANSNNADTNATADNTLVGTTNNQSSSTGTGDVSGSGASAEPDNQQTAAAVSAAGSSGVDNGAVKSTEASTTNSDSVSGAEGRFGPDALKEASKGLVEHAVELSTEVSAQAGGLASITGAQAQGAGKLFGDTMNVVGAYQDGQQIGTGINQIAQGQTAEGFTNYGAGAAGLGVKFAGVGAVAGGASVGMAAAAGGAASVSILLVKSTVDAVRTGQPTPIGVADQYWGTHVGDIIGWMKGDYSNPAPAAPSVNSVVVRTPPATSLQSVPLTQP